MALVVEAGAVGDIHNRMTLGEQGLRLVYADLVQVQLRRHPEVFFKGAQEVEFADAGDITELC